MIGVTMTIPAHILELLEGPLWAHAGTRDGQLVPHHHFTWGIRATANRAEIEVLLPNLLAGRLRENVADNGRIALTFGESVSHATFQIKGRCVEVRDPTDAERAFQRRWAEAAVAHMRQFNPPHLMPKFEGLADAPSTYIRLSVEEIYDQTPGPAAGQKVPLQE